jgi:hypothetical protein
LFFTERAERKKGVISAFLSDTFIKKYIRPLIPVKILVKLTVGTESAQGPGVSLRIFDLPVPGRSGGHKRVDQFGGCLGDFVDRPLERLFIRCRRLCESADLQ